MNIHEFTCYYKMKIFTLKIVNYIIFVLVSSSSLLSLDILSKERELAMDIVDDDQSKLLLVCSYMHNPGRSWYYF